MASKNKTDSLRAIGCLKDNYWKCRWDGSLQFQKATVTYFFNTIDDDFSKDNFVTKIFMKTCSILSTSPEKTLLTAPFIVSQDTDFLHKTILQASF